MSQQHAPRIDDYVNELLGEETAADQEAPTQTADMAEPAPAPETAVNPELADAAEQADVLPEEHSPAPDVSVSIAASPPEPEESPDVTAVQQAPSATAGLAPPSQAITAQPQVPDNFPLDLEKWLEPVTRDSDESPTAPALRCVSFRLQGQYFAAEVKSLLEVLARADIVPVPSAQPPILGILNLRGSIVTVLDPAQPLGLSSGHEDAGQLIIADFEGEPVALRVDAVGEVVTLEEEELRNPPSAADHVRGLASLDDDMLTLLDLQKLLRKTFPSV
mgnify:CR=1 FL=1